MKSLMKIERDHMKKRVANFSVGDTVKVHVKVIEGDKVRNQIFQGTVIGRRGGGLRETFVVRKISSGIAVERIFPVHSPSVAKIEVLRRGRVRRAQLTYLKSRKGKRARVTGLRVSGAEAEREEALQAAAEAEAKAEAEAAAKAAEAPEDGAGEAEAPAEDAEVKEEAPEAVES